MSAPATLASSVTVSGVGIHTGADAVVTLAPSETPGNGIIFALSKGLTLTAFPLTVVDTSRCTVLGGSIGGKVDPTVSTVEHVLSALAALGITDALITVDGPELPIGDGSALIWTDAIARAGGARLFAGTLNENQKKAWTLAEPLMVTGKNGSFIAAYPSDALRLTVASVFDHGLAGTQVARFDFSTDDYVRDVAPARTFGFIEEVEALQAAGLARGGSFENAVVVYPDRYSSELRFPDELARHKLLDLIGDLSLAFPGERLPALEIFAVKPSHFLNVELARRLWRLRGERQPRHQTLKTR